MMIIYFSLIIACYADDTINLNQNTLLNDDPQTVKNILMKPIAPANAQPNNLNAKSKEDSPKISGSLLVSDNTVKEQSRWMHQNNTVSSNDVTSQKPNEVNMFPNSVTNGGNNAQQNNETAQTTSIKIGKHLIRNMPINAIYRVNGRNFISESGVNAIVAPIKITGFVPEPGSVTFQWINDNHGIAFQIKGERKTLQAIVTFESQKTPVSLFFDVTNVPGRVISLPSSLTGTLPLVNDSQFSNKNSDSYDKYITHLMNTIVSGKSLGQAWQYQESATTQNPYNEIAVKRYQHWFNRIYSIKNFELCSQSNEIVSLNEKTFASTVTLAITLTKHRLKPGECSRLVVMARNHIDDADSSDVYTPSQEK